MWMARNFGYFFMLPGLAMLLGGITVGVRHASFRQSAERAQGTVISNRYSADSDGGGTYHPEVEFVDHDGRRHTFISTTGSSPASFKVGERVPILYQRDQPEDGSIDTFFQQWFMSLLLSGLGFVFTSVGVIPLVFRARREKLGEWLKLNGRPIQADYTGAQLRTNIEINGRNPYRITAQWLNPATNQVTVFHSENLWFDPSPYVSSKTISVLIDPASPKRYWMDTSFLPKLAG